VARADEADGIPTRPQVGQAAEKGEAVAVRQRKNMAKLLKSPEEAKKAITARILAGKDLTAKADIAERTGGHEDWLVIFAKWREETAAELTTLYEEGDIEREFSAVTTTGV
jgi:hypothetical protein